MNKDFAIGAKRCGLRMLAAAVRSQLAGVKVCVAVACTYAKRFGRSRQQAAFQQRSQATAFASRAMQSVPCAFILATALTSCHRDVPAANPVRRHQIYDIAWRRGLADQLTPLPNDWQRYRAKLEPYGDVPDRESIFSAGYDDGFHQHPEQERDIPEMAYDGGYRNAQEDAWQHKPANDKTDAFDHEAYAKGYGDGFNGRSHAFGRPY